MASGNWVAKMSRPASPKRTRESERARHRTMGRNTWRATLTEETDGKVTVTTRVRLATRVTWGEPSSTTYDSWVEAAMMANREAATMSRRGWATDIEDTTGRLIGR